MLLRCWGQDGEDPDDPGFMGDFLAKKKVVEATVAKLGEETQLLQELQDRAALAVDGREEGGTSGCTKWRRFCTRDVRYVRVVAALYVGVGVVGSVISKELKALIKRVNKSTREAQGILKAMAAENKKFKKARKRAKQQAKEEGREFVDEHAHVLRCVATMYLFLQSCVVAGS